MFPIQKLLYDEVWIGSADRVLRTGVRRLGGSSCALERALICRAAFSSMLSRATYRHPLGDQFGGTVVT